MIGNYQNGQLPARKRVTYALNAAARVVNVNSNFGVNSSSGTSDPIPQLTIPSQLRTTFEASTDPMPSTSITVKLFDVNKDSAGNTMAEATITLGAATAGNSAYALGAFSGDQTKDTSIGARVLISGLSRSKRIPLFPRLFGIQQLSRSASQVTAVYDYVTAAQNPDKALSIIGEKPPL